MFFQVVIPHDFTTYVTHCSFVTITRHYGALYSSNTCTERTNWTDSVFLYPFIYYTADVSKNTNYGHNHYLVPFFKSLIQVLHAQRAKGKVKKSKMAEHSSSMCLLCLNVSECVCSVLIVKWTPTPVYPILMKMYPTQFGLKCCSVKTWPNLTHFWNLTQSDPLSKPDSFWLTFKTWLNLIHFKTWLILTHF